MLDEAIRGGGKPAAGADTGTNGGAMVGGNAAPGTGAGAGENTAPGEKPVTGADALTGGKTTATSETSAPGENEFMSDAAALRLLFTPQELAVERGRMHTAQRRQQAMRTRDMSRRERDMTAAFLDGRETAPGDLPGEQDFTAAFGPEDGPKRYAALQENRQFGEHLTRLRDMTPEDQEAFALAEESRNAGKPGAEGMAAQNGTGESKGSGAKEALVSGTLYADAGNLHGAVLSDAGHPPLAGTPDGDAVFEADSPPEGVFGAGSNPDAVSGVNSDSDAISGVNSDSDAISGTEAAPEAKASVWSLARRALARDQELRGADPAAYVLRAAPETAPLLDAARKNPVPETVAAYADAVRAAYAARGMDENGPLLPTEAAADLAELFTQGTPKEAAQAVMSHKNAWGEDWGRVFMQAAPIASSLPPVVAALAAVFPELSVKNTGFLIEAARTRLDELNLSPTRQEEIKNRAAASPLMNLFPASQAAPDLAAGAAPEWENLFPAAFPAR